MDYTLTGFKGLKAKRRNMSLIFNLSLDVPRQFSSVAPLFSINRDKNQYTNTFQEVDTEEKRHILADLLKAEPLQGAFDIKNFAWTENKGIFGNVNSHKIGEWDAKKFDFKIIMEYGVLKKSKSTFQENHESYMHVNESQSIRH